MLGFHKETPDRFEPRSLGLRGYLVLGIVVPVIMTAIFVGLFTITDGSFERCVFGVAFAGCISIPIWMLRNGYRWSAIVGFFLPLVSYLSLNLIILQAHFKSKMGSIEDGSTS